jgi:hypothetical protein
LPAFSNLDKLALAFCRNRQGLNKMRVVATIAMGLVASATVMAQPPATPNKVDTPTVTVLTGLTVPEFEQEMQHFVQATGVSCGGCHVRGNFASDENARKLKARQMIEMTKMLNKQFFPDHKPAEGESVLGRVTCYTCHKGEAKPKAAP